MERPGMARQIRLATFIVVVATIFALPETVKKDAADNDRQR
jgi:hypothetical protein